MSDILIKNMKMPKNCEGCKLIPGYCKHRNIYCMDDNQKKFIRPKDCPLVEVPPHGRLGDLDRLEQMFVDIDNAPYSEFDGEEPFYTAEDAAQIIRLSPTIIPAEEGE